VGVDNTLAGKAPGVMGQGKEVVANDGLSKRKEKKARADCPRGGSDKMQRGGIKKTKNQQVEGGTRGGGKGKN